MSRKTKVTSAAADCKLTGHRASVKPLHCRICLASLSRATFAPKVERNSVLINIGITLLQLEANIESPLHQELASWIERTDLPDTSPILLRSKAWIPH